MRFHCEYPFCDYKTNKRSKIDYHHIIPKEAGGSDDSSNRLWLCPNHHRNIFINESSAGIHATPGDKTLKLIGKFYSTSGYVLAYQESGISKLFPLHY